MSAVLNEGLDLQQCLRTFVATGSTEVTPHDVKLLDDFARVVPAQFRVYVAHTPKATLDEVVRVALRLAALGMRPVPHIVARRVDSLDRLRAALGMLGGAGIDEILLIAGDRAVPEGRFASALDVLETGVMYEAGITRVGVAGHPEGHPAVPDAALWEALEHKQAFGLARGIQMHIATQFGFDSRSLGSWERGLAARGITLPIHAGIAGPAPLPKLLRYALQCGVGASLKAVSGNALSIGRLPHFVTRADEMLLGVYGAKQHNSDSRIFAPHFFAFGGVLETARWLRAVIDGSFELNADESGFSICN
jgi:methylenetetrahydrofolate reductase (NADPH)